MVMAHLDDYPSEWAAMTSVASKFGIAPETLRTWVRRAQVDGGQRPGLSTDEREVRDLRRANEILKDASIIFATELIGRTK
jgi:transposase-like protein